MSDEPIKETVCEECEHKPKEETKFCPKCGAEDPWIERNAYEFDEDDLPIVFSFETYNDNWELWGEFYREYFGHSELKGSDIAGMPDDFPSLKYLMADLYFVITENLEVKGPFLEESEARSLSKQN